ncbi:cbb3-type cytochrome oxidase assembly protein CcoS [Arsukibacterium sp.]|uniref:cbb3-type cytochrome oxidase assembly protein CcoS n=1 Tax=Arsukibacterium sp. TaxID=1977258 RepID=UPI00299D5F2B|nr:cbb3-type cytochrome oxidase assembly protein CcoS [Arsukibacterium sp.]MDX1537996.1 cbb3-type cytochrome oxidase assembly protein CcoS [Arsukibacterium sp.]
MSIIYVLIPIAILFVMLGLAIFFWAVRSKQFEDLDKEGFSILFDEQQAQAKTSAETAKQEPAEQAEQAEQAEHRQDKSGQ